MTHRECTAEEAKRWTREHSGRLRRWPGRRALEPAAAYPAYRHAPGHSGGDRFRLRRPECGHRLADRLLGRLPVRTGT